MKKKKSYKEIRQDILSGKGVIKLSDKESIEIFKDLNKRPEKKRTESTIDVKALIKRFEKQIKEAKNEWGDLHENDFWDFKGILMTYNEYRAFIEYGEYKRSLKNKSDGK